jgi:hypothetical protein
MTAINVPATALPRTEVATDEMCAACAHPLADHDATGRRYCAATSTMGLTRGCICPK